MITAPIGVLIVDDSAVMRQCLTARLRESGIEVIGAVPDPVFAIGHMRRAWPDVVLLDPVVSGAGGLAFIRKIMSTRPTPVVLCTSPAARSADVVLAAMTAGAAGVVTKPVSGLKAFLENESADIVAAVLAAANTRRIPRTAPGGHDRRDPGRPRPRTVPAPAVPAEPATVRDRMIAIGASTGGTRALETVLPALSRDVPGVVIVQHMPERFTAAFAERLDTMCRVRVSEAVDGEEVLPGRALVAPGGRHLEVVHVGAGYRVRVFDASPVNRHRPSVDVLFRSVARAAGSSALGVILTGMGDDGAQGLLAMRRAGAFTVAQDEATCVVHGMPREAVQAGAVNREVPLTGIAEVIHRHG